MNQVHVLNPIRRQPPTDSQYLQCNSSPSQPKNIASYLSISALLKAAQFLDQQETSVDHKYASSSAGSAVPQPEQPIRCPVERPLPPPPVPESHSQHLAKKLVKSRNPTSRMTHNELEKNRRAFLREAMDELRRIIPWAKQDVNMRHTTLGLLKKTREFISELHARDKKNAQSKEQLVRRQRQLQKKVLHLQRKLTAAANIHTPPCVAAGGGQPRNGGGGGASLVLSTHGAYTTTPIELVTAAKLIPVVAPHTVNNFSHHRHVPQRSNSECSSSGDSNTGSECSSTISSGPEDWNLNEQMLNEDELDMCSHVNGRTAAAATAAAALQAVELFNGRLILS